MLVKPDVIVLRPLLEEENVARYEGVRREDAIWQTQDGVQVEVPHEESLDLGADTGIEEHAIRNNDRAPRVRVSRLLQPCHY